jgi:hypothetical protein
MRELEHSGSQVVPDGPEQVSDSAQR